MKLAEVKKNCKAIYPIGSFSGMGDTKMKTIKIVRAIAAADGRRILVANVESMNPHTGKKKDMFGIFDALAVDGATFRGLQACGTDWNPHVEKLRENVETCRRWLRPGNSTIELWGWRRVKRKGRMVFRPRLQVITLDFLEGREMGKPSEVFED